MSIHLRHPQQRTRARHACPQHILGAPCEKVQEQALLGRADHREVPERPIGIDLQLEALLVAQVQHTDEADSDAHVRGLRFGHSPDRAVNKILEAAIGLLLPHLLGILDILCNAIQQVLLDQLDVHKLRVAAVADVGVTHSGWPIHEVEVEVRRIGCHVVAAHAHVAAHVVEVGHAVLAVAAAPGQHLLAGAQEEVLGVDVEVRGQPAVAREVVVVGGIIAELHLALGAASVLLVLVAPRGGRGAGLCCQPRVGFGVLNDHGGEEVGEAVGAVGLGHRLPNELEHQVWPEAQASEVAFGPRRPARHRDPVNHVRRHVLVQLPLRSALAELVLGNRLGLNRLRGRAQACDVEERPLWGLLLGIVHGHQRALGAGRAILLSVSRSSRSILALALLRGLRPTLVEVSELVRTASRSAELLKQLVECNHILVSFQSRPHGDDRMLRVRERQGEVAVALRACRLRCGSAGWAGAWCGDVVGEAVA
mmetsp:Transcript_90568/g.230412  ORF Transcript_90568/g.230412 Transcript_90568/m.230412 type:complete len:480 (+) Transcript_90568:143-1582(+)